MHDTEADRRPHCSTGKGLNSSMANRKRKNLRFLKGFSVLNLGNIPRYFFYTGIACTETHDHPETVISQDRAPRRRAAVLVLVRPPRKPVPPEAMDARRFSRSRHRPAAVLRSLAKAPRQRRQRGR